MLQNATPLRKSAPWPPNISHEHVFCTAPATRDASLQVLFKCPTPAIAFGNATKPSRSACLLLTRCTIPCACHAKRHLNFQKCSVPVSFLHFSLGLVLRATTACTFSTSQLPCMVCFVHFDFEMCFAPQRPALFRHLNFQKWSEREVFCTFWLGKVLRATMACTFSTSQLPKVVQWGVFSFFTYNVLRVTTACNFSSLIWPAGSAPAALASLLFDPSEPQIIWKTQCFATFPAFRAPASSFFWLFLFFDLLSSTLLFSLTLPISAFHLSILSEVWLLNFLRLYDICRMYIYIYI